MDLSFKLYYEHTLKWEGGAKLHNVEGDSGGWTKYGIAYNYNKHHFDSLDDFKEMSFEKACEITYENYYLALHLDLVNPDAREQLFDIAFNAGVKRAFILAQRALGLIDDGICGKVTKACLKNLDNTKLYNERVKFYMSLAKNNSKLNKFLKGWLRRANDFK